MVGQSEHRPISSTPLRSVTLGGSILILVFSLTPNFRIAAEPKTDELLGQARAAKARGDLEQAFTLANRAIELDPKNPKTHFLRGALYQAAGQHQKAIADYTEVLRLEPRAAQAWQQRGSERFLLGQFKEAVADYDQFLALHPQQAPQHWQRGIACYYAGLYEEGRKQFELHQTVNPQDVENAVWHFLCVAKLEGVEQARARLIHVHDDHRVPMMKVHALFEGKARPDDVLAALKANNPSEKELGHRTFYANLYLGLYYEATADAARAREHIFKAEKLAEDNGFMGTVARVHAERLRAADQKDTTPK